MHSIILYQFFMINSIVSGKNINKWLLSWFFSQKDLNFHFIQLVFNHSKKKKKKIGIIFWMSMEDKKKDIFCSVPFVVVSGPCWWPLWPRPHPTCSGRGLYLSRLIPTETKTCHYEKINVYVAIYKKKLL